MRLEAVSCCVEGEHVGIPEALSIRASELPQEKTLRAAREVCARRRGAVVDQEHRSTVTRESGKRALAAAVAFNLAGCDPVRPDHEALRRDRPTEPVTDQAAG